MQKDSKIYLVVGLVVAVAIIGLVVFFGKGDTGPSKYDGFATALKDQGAVFYGAFWCPHCQATKALFGSAAKKLPYVECSTLDGNGQTQACIDKKIESYPTWSFKDGIKITSGNEPTICPIKINDVKEEGVCANVASSYYKVWVFPEFGFSVKSPSDPIKNGDVWQFPSESYTVGELPLSFIATQINFTLPQ